MADKQSPLDVLGNAAALVSERDEKLRRKRAAEESIPEVTRNRKAQQQSSTEFAQHSNNRNPFAAIPPTAKAAPPLPPPAAAYLSGPSLPRHQSAVIASHDPYNSIDYIPKPYNAYNYSMMRYPIPAPPYNLPRKAYHLPEPVPSSALFNASAAAAAAAAHARATLLDRKLAAAASLDSQIRYRTAAAAVRKASSSSSSSMNGRTRRPSQLRFSKSDRMPTHVPPNEIATDDIYCGQEYRGSKHPGNIAFRQLIHDHKAEYISFGSHHGKKTEMSNYILEELVKGRFLRMHPDGEFYLLTKKEARKKVSQGLREK